MFESLTCLSVAVSDLEQAILSYEQLGFQVRSEVQHSQRGFGLAWVTMGNGHRDLLELLSADGSGPVADFLSKRGEGPYQARLEVPDLEAMVGSLRDRGIHVIDDPNPGASRSRLAWIHPQFSHGVLFELVEPPRHGRGGGSR